MHLSLKCPTAALALATSVAAATAPRPAVAQDDRGIELIEAKTALAAALSRVDELKTELVETRKQIGALGESLAAANGESEAFRESYQELRLQLEALGVDLLRKDSRGLDRRLLQAVSDLRISEEKNQELRNQVVRLSEVIMDFMNSAVTSDVAARTRVEAELRSTESALRPASESAALTKELKTLDGARVVSIKPEYGLLVLDAGDKNKVTIGTPIRLRRDDQDIATAVIVDVRSSVCGAVLTGHAASDLNVRVGDIARLDTQKPLQN